MAAGHYQTVGHRTVSRVLQAAFEPTIRNKSAETFDQNVQTSFVPDCR